MQKGGGQNATKLNVERFCVLTQSDGKQGPSFKTQCLPPKASGCRNHMTRA